MFVRLVPAVYVISFRHVELYVRTHELMKIRRFIKIKYNKLLFISIACKLKMSFPLIQLSKSIIIHV
jgi:hypothetical protein